MKEKKSILLIISFLVFFILIIFSFKKLNYYKARLAGMDKNKVTSSTEIVKPTNTVDCIKKDDGLCHYYEEKNKDANYFKSYTLVYPESWTLEVDQAPTLTKGPLKITIIKKIAGGGNCFYKGDTNIIEPAAYVDANYISVDREDNYNWRITWDSKNQSNRSVCEYNPYSDRFMNPTKVGVIDIMTSEKMFTKDQLEDIKQIISDIQIHD